MAKIIGALARAGKVKYHMTPQVNQTNNDHSYSGQGRSKFRIKSSTNVQYKSGAYRLHKTLTPTAASSSASGEVVISNSYHKYNTESGYNRVEHKKAVEDQQEQKWKYRRMNYSSRRDANHNKWHRNHPKDGFYQKREEFGTDEDYL